jgi:aminoglycoside phosphotransferase (APT) family kinase protein
VLAPVAPADGGALVRLDDRYAVSLYEYVEGTCKTHLDVVTTKERREVLAMLGKVHATTIPDAIPRREDFAVRLRSEFFDALADETSWRSGPFAESAQQLVLSKGSHVRELFDRYDELVNAVSARSQFVVTHGEPHPENVMRLSDGRVCLIDWDTAALAPPERDLWMIEPQSDAEVAAYISSGGVPAIDPDAINLYRRQWTLAEIAIYTKTFRDDHVNDANTQVAWREFQKYVDG